MNLDSCMKLLLFSKRVNDIITSFSLLLHII